MPAVARANRMARPRWRPSASRISLGILALVWAEVRVSGPRTHADDEVEALPPNPLGDGGHLMATAADDEFLPKGLVLRHVRR